MLIPITLSTSCAASPKLPSSLAKISHEEVVLIELQGSLDVESNHPSERNGQFVGKLNIDEAMNKPTLMIGNHLLEGKIQVLPKPLAVLVRSRSSANVSHPKPIIDIDHYSLSVDEKLEEEAELDGEETHEDSAMVVDVNDNPVDSGGKERQVRNGSRSGMEGSGANWTVVAIVRKKIIFSKRPMPISNKNIR